MAYMVLQPSRQDSHIQKRFPVSSTGASLNALLQHMLTAHYDHQYHMAQQFIYPHESIQNDENEQEKKTVF